MYVYCMCEIISHNTQKELFNFFYLESLLKGIFLSMLFIIDGIDTTVYLYVTCIIDGIDTYSLSVCHMYNLECM